MKIIFLIVTLLGTTHLFSLATNINDINYLRKEFNLALNNHKKATVLHTQLATLMPAFNTLQYAYLGATEALLAKHSFNPFTKLSFVNSALGKINNAIALNKTNIEIRFMRFSVESELPFYLGFSKHVVEDKNAIINGLKNVTPTAENREMLTVFATNLLNSSLCNKEEKHLLSSLISAYNNTNYTKK